MKLHALSYNLVLTSKHGAGNTNVQWMKLWGAEVKAEPKTVGKRRSPSQPSSQPAAKKGRLVRQRSPPISTEGANMDSDATVEECVSPSKQGKGKKHALESDDDEDYVPGQLATQNSIKKAGIVINQVCAWQPFKCSESTRLVILLTSITAPSSPSVLRMQCVYS